MISGRHKIVTADSGRSHTVVVTDDGQSFAFGWNKHGQLGSGSLRNGKTGSLLHLGMYLFVGKLDLFLFHLLLLLLPEAERLVEG